jgi:hypothetical protein
MRRIARRRLSPEVLQVLERLEAVVKDLHYQWDLFQALFGRDQRPAQLFAAFGPDLYTHLRATLGRSMLVTIRLLSENPTTGFGKNERRNASLKGMVQAVWGDYYERRPRSKISRFLKMVCGIEEAKAWVNRSFAHLDWETVVNDPSAGQEIDPHQFRDAIHAAAAILNMVRREASGYEVDYRSRARQDVGEMLTLVLAGLHARGESRRACGGEDPIKGATPPTARGSG